jgi:hypothetical protein
MEQATCRVGGKNGRRGEGPSEGQEAEDNVRVSSRPRSRKKDGKWIECKIKGRIGRPEDDVINSSN